MSDLVKSIIDEDEDDDEEEENERREIPLINVSSDILEKVIAFCKHFQTEPMTAIEIPLKSNKLEDLVQTWYSEYVKLPKQTLFDLVAAANYMDIKPLLDLTCLAVSILIKGKSAEELREMFHLTTELNLEEQNARMEQDEAAENNE